MELYSAEDKVDTTWRRATSASAISPRLEISDVFSAELTLQLAAGNQDSELIQKQNLSTTLIRKLAWMWIATEFRIFHELGVSCKILLVPNYRSSTAPPLPPTTLPLPNNIELGSRELSCGGIRTHAVNLCILKDCFLCVFINNLDYKVIDKPDHFLERNERKMYPSLTDIITNYFSLLN